MGVSASRRASSGWSSTSHPSGIPDPTLRQHAPREPALPSWGRFQVIMWSSLALLLPRLHDTVLCDNSSPCVPYTKFSRSASTRVTCAALDSAYPTLVPLAFAFDRPPGGCAGVCTLRHFWLRFAMCAAGAVCRLTLLDAH